MEICHLATNSLHVVDFLFVQLEFLFSFANCASPRQHHTPHSLPLTSNHWKMKHKRGNKFRNPKHKCTLQKWNGWGAEDKIRITKELCSICENNRRHKIIWNFTEPEAVSRHKRWWNPGSLVATALNAEQATKTSKRKCVWKLGLVFAAAVTRSRRSRSIACR